MISTKGSTLISEVTLSELAAVHAEGALVVDVREPEEYRAGHVPGAVSLPLGVVPVRAHELPKDQPVFVVCQSGGRSYQAAEGLHQAGYDARSVAGGTGGWVQAGRPVVRGTEPR